MLFDQTELGVGTGFFWQTDSNLYLITNWHNVSGIDPFTGKHVSEETAAEPNRLRIWWNAKGKLWQKFSATHPIKDSNDKPLWLVHPTYKNQIDVVALPISAPDNAEPYPINEMPHDDLRLQAGMDVFVLGYPFGITHSGLPIWKRGSIASEPEILDPKRPVILIDSATRRGMSGAPVIRRSWGTHTMADGNPWFGSPTATKFVGVYSGRMATKDQNDPQLGLTWPTKFVEEIVNGRTVDP